jgi:hypothetical protein
MLTYFVQVNVCWLLFYGAYFALLSRETFFRLNRLWLIISLLGGLILPWLAPTLEVAEPTNMAAVMLQPFVVSAEDLSQNLQNRDASLLIVLTAIYALGLAITLGKLLFGFWKIKRLLNRADRLPMNDFTLMQVREAIAPFSFFRWVFINLNLIEPTDLQQIILHERAHVRERHSIDVMFAELLGVVFWWSPLVYFYTKSLKNVHEYAADSAVLRTSSPPQYGRLLLRQQQSGMSLSLTNPFFSQLKKRILMMTRNPSKRRALAKYALAVPIFLVLTLLLASPKTKVMATTEAATERVVASIETFEKNINPLPKTELSQVSEKPVVFFAGKRGGSITAEDVVNQDRLEAYQVVNGKTVPVEVQYFILFRVSKSGNSVQSNNVGGQFSDATKQLIKMAAIDDSYQFMHVKCRTKNETTPFDAGSMAFVVKSMASTVATQNQLGVANNLESPTILLAGKRGGVIDAKILAQQDHLDAYQVVNGQNVPVEILSFILFRVPSVGDPYQSNNVGGQFSEDTRRITDMAATNDNFQFIDIKCRVKGSATVFDGGSMAFVVKGGTPQYNTQKDSSDPVFTIVEELPGFVGGNDSLFRFLGRNIKYPASAREAGVEGTVYIGFVVEKDGSITNATVKRNVPESKTRVDTIQQFLPETGKTVTKIVKFQDQTCADEAVRVINSMPKWKAGRHKGKPVRVAFTLPIKFKLE